MPPAISWRGHIKIVNTIEEPKFFLPFYTYYIITYMFKYLRLSKSPVPLACRKRRQINTYFEDGRKGKKHNNNPQFKLILEHPFKIFLEPLLVGNLGV
jgi:hypothetical protein